VFSHSPLTEMFSPPLWPLNDELDLARGRVGVGGQLLQQEAVDVVEGDVEAVHRPQDVAKFQFRTRPGCRAGINVLKPFHFYS
jgi:hypothetical protein